MAASLRGDGDARGAGDRADAPARPIVARRAPSGETPGRMDARAAAPPPAPLATIVVATGNAHKLDELRAMLADLPLRLVGLPDLPRAVEMPEETGATFEANADLKSLHIARETGLLALADDSGFEVPALGDRPGVISARYAGPTGTPREIDLANNRKLLAEARDAGLFRDPARPPAARFRCVLSLARPDGGGAAVVCRGAGSCDGVLVEEARGGGGFGYDPHFLVPDLGLTFAEIPPAEKNRRSHRARALDDLRRSLGPLLLEMEAKRRP
jgi:XTP/dITP diphosphohydrolase